MSKTLTKVASAAALSLIACATQATPLPGLTNQDFTQYTGSAPKNCFSCVNPVGWTGGSGLIYIDAPGTATSTTGGIGVYGPFSDPPTGGNYVPADVDGEGEFELDGGDLVLRDLWLGSAKDATGPAGCGHRLE